MQRLCIISLVSGLLLASLASAYDTASQGPQTAIAFPHQLHQQALGGCTDCHGKGEPGKISGYGEKWGHSNCVGCHRDGGTGPLECSGCHGSDCF